MTEVPRQSPQTHMYERQGNMELLWRLLRKPLELSRISRLLFMDYAKALRTLRLRHQC